MNWKETYTKIFLKQANISIGEKKISINGVKKSLYPILREDGTTLYYEFDKGGIFRIGKKFLKQNKITLENKRMVLPTPISLDKSWFVDSETYLILRKYNR